MPRNSCSGAERRQGCVDERSLRTHPRVEVEFRGGLKGQGQRAAELVENQRLRQALQVDGQRLYEAARKGRDVVVEARDVEIFDLELLSFAAPVFFHSVRWYFGL